MPTKSVDVEDTPRTTFLSMFLKKEKSKIGVRGSISGISSKEVVVVVEYRLA